MTVLIDMNLSPSWVPVLAERNINAIHWSQVGSNDAPDREIFLYAQQHDCIVFTHDLDFGDILAATGAASPSVIQVRTDDTSPEALIDHFMSATEEFHPYLEKGALITIVLEKYRVRILPVGPADS